MPNDTQKNTREQFRKDLEGVRAHAKHQLKHGDEPPWAWFQYMKLVEITESTLESLDAVIPLEDSPVSDLPPEKRLQLVATTDPQDIVRLHRDDSEPVLPM